MLASRYGWKSESRSESIFLAWEACVETSQTGSTIQEWDISINRDNSIRVVIYKVYFYWGFAGRCSTFEHELLRETIYNPVKRRMDLF